MELTTCPHCQTRVAAGPAGRCPSCGRDLTASSTPPAGVASAESDNPFSAPAVAPPSQPKAAAPAKQPFSHQAARFSLYAPVVLVVLNFAFKSQLDAGQGPDVSRQLSIGWAVLSLWIQVTGLAMGLVGFVGGISRGAAWTIVIATIGILLIGDVACRGCTTHRAASAPPMS
jgi:hypothetical protein